MSDKPMIPWPSFDGSEAAPAASQRTSQTAPQPSLPVPAASAAALVEEMITSFSAPVQTRMRAIYADKTPAMHGPIKRALVVIAEVAPKEPAGVVAFYEAIHRHGEDEHIAVVDLADLANHAGNAVSRLGRVEESLKLHERACALLATSLDASNRNADHHELVNIYAYGLCQQARRCSVLERVDDALDRVRILAAMEHVHINAWVRNRFWEATLMATDLLTDDKPQQALAFAKQALTVSAFQANDYTHTAQVLLHNRVALCARKLKRFDEAHDACMLVKAMIKSLLHTRLTDERREDIAWALLEGAFIGRLRKRPQDTLPFLDALPQVAPLQDSDRDYGAILRCDALITQNKIAAAEAALVGVGKATDRWVLAAGDCVRAQLAWAKGDKALSHQLAERVVAEYSNDKDCQDEVERAQGMLAT